MALEQNGSPPVTFPVIAVNDVTVPRRGSEGDNKPTMASLTKVRSCDSATIGTSHPHRPSNHRLATAVVLAPQLNFDAPMAVFLHLQDTQLSYRTVTASPTQSASLKKKFKPAVSFDTINIRYDDGAEESPRGRSKESLGHDMTFFSPDREGKMSPTRDLSPGNLEFSPERNRGLPGIGDVSEFLFAKFGAAMEDHYAKGDDLPHSCTLRSEHHDFKKLYSNAHPTAHHMFHRRTLIVYISGRRHTWVALDWILRKLVANGDTLVVVSALNHEPQSTRRGSAGHVFNAAKKKRRTSFHSNGDDYLDQEFDDEELAAIEAAESRNAPARIGTVAQNILDYIYELLPVDRVIRITIELAVGSTKSVVKDMMETYKPHLACVAAKLKNSTGAPLTSWKLSRLSDRLVKNFPLPVIVVPALNMGDFEERLFGHLQARGTRLKAEPLASPSADRYPSVYVSDDSLGETDVEQVINDFTDRFGSALMEDAVSIMSLESAGSGSSAPSSQGMPPYHVIIERFAGAASDIERQLRAIKTDTSIDAKRSFMALLAAVSDNSLHLCREMTAILSNDQGEGDNSKLVRKLTGLDHMPHLTKVKSMLDIGSNPKDPINSLDNSAFLKPPPSTLRFHTPSPTTPSSGVQSPTSAISDDLLPSRSAPVDNDNSRALLLKGKEKKKKKIFGGLKFWK